MRAQRYAAPVHQRDFPDGFSRSDRAGTRIIEVNDFAWQRKLDEVFCRRGLRLVNDHKNLRP